MKTKEPSKAIEIEDPEGLRSRLRNNKLSQEDLEDLDGLLLAFVSLQALVRKRGISILKVLRRLFGFKTERRKSNEDHCKDKNKSATEGKGRSGRNGRDDYPGAEKVEVEHPDYKENDDCPECVTGKLREAEPGVDYEWKGSAPLNLKIFLLQRFICNLCKTTFTAPSPATQTAHTVDDSQDAVKATRCDRNAMANSVVAGLRFWYGVPHYRLAQIQGSMGMALPVATQYRMLLQAYQAALPIYAHLIELAAQGSLMKADDTAIKILDWLAGKGPPAKSTGQAKKKAQTSAIISKTADGRAVALFFTGAKEAGAEVKEILKKRDLKNGPPIYMCDGLAANNPGSQVEVIQVHCLDHARRQFYDLQSIYTEKVDYVLEKLQLVYQYDREAKNKEMSSQNRLEHHKKFSAPVMNELGKWMQEQLNGTSVEENDELGKAIKYSLKRWSELNEFYKIPGVPLSNAECEMLIKRIVRHRKNSLAYKTLNGAHVGDVLQSVIATCEKAGGNILEYLAWIQENKSACIANPELFTPWIFLKK